MEDVLFGIAVALFVISGVSTIASVVVFKKLEVADAIRFLRHRTTASGVGLVGVLAHKPKQRKAKGEDLERDIAPSIARKKGKHEREESSDDQGASSKLATSASLSKKNSGKLQGGSSNEAAKWQAMGSSAGEIAFAGGNAARKVASDSATTILADADLPATRPETADSGNLGSERPTDLLVCPDTANEVDDDDLNASSERPTEMLVCGDSENPTKILPFTGPSDVDSAEQTNSVGLEKDAPDSERPTELLASIDNSERKTTFLEPLSSSASAAVPTKEESVFWFRIKQSQIVVNTDETIE